MRPFPNSKFPFILRNLFFVREQLNSLTDQDDLSFGNSVYKITFEKREDKPLFGHKYWFFLQDAVENVPEYIVRWDNFVQYVLFILS